MPAEAIHLSALTDSLDQSLAQGLLQDPRACAHARLGAVLIDLPYFDRFPRLILKYLLKLPVTASQVADICHTTRPIHLGKALVRCAVQLRREPGTRALGERMLAIAAGYFSHVAVDTSLHPLVNRQARVRAERLSDRPSRQHTEVEKFHSILFHEERLGFDFMGKRALYDHIHVEAALLLLEPALFSAYVAALNDVVRPVLGRDIPAAEVRGWARGYIQYVLTVSSPFGKFLMPQSVKDEVRHEVYRGDWGSFQAEYQRAVLFSRKLVEATFHLAESEDEAPFDRLIPEGSIDG